MDLKIDVLDSLLILWSYQYLYIVFIQIKIWGSDANEKMIFHQ